MNKTIAITGANGFIGSELVDYFSEYGWTVIALVRDRSSVKNVASRPYDLMSDPDENILVGIDYLVHCAYIKGSDDITYSTNVNGTRRLLKLGLSTGTKKNIMLSSLSSKRSAESIYGRQKYSIEKLFTGKKCAVIRPGLVIGDGGLVREIYKIIKTKHVIPLIRGGRQPIQITDPHTIAEAIRKIIEKDLHGTYTIATQEPYDYRDFYKMLVKKTGTWAILIPIPYALLMLIFQIIRFTGLRIGVTAENLKGIRNIHEIVETDDDFKRIGITKPNFEDILASVRFK